MKIAVVTSSLLILYISSLLGAEPAQTEPRVETPDNGADQLKKSITEINTRIDEIETVTMLTKLKFGAEFKTTLNNYIYTDQSSPDTKEIGLLRQDGKSTGLLNWRARFKMNSTIADKFHFYAWISAYKNFNVSGSSEVYDHLTDIKLGQYPDGKVYFERAYGEIFFTDWLALTVGRTPTTNGYPANIRNNSVLLGTFDETTFNAPFDTVFLTFLLEKAGIENGYLRFLLVKSSFLDSFSQNTFTTDQNPDYISLGILYEMKIPGIKESRVSLNFLYSLLSLPLNQRASLDTTSHIEYSGYLSKPLVLSLTAGAENIASTGLTLFGSFSWTHITSPDIQKEDDGVVYRVTKDSTGKEIRTPFMAMLGRVDGKSEEGYLVYGGIQWKTPLKMADDRLKIGADYNYTTKFYYINDVPDTTGIERFLIKGHYVDSYIIFPLAATDIFLKTGYILTRSDHFCKSPFGLISQTPEETITPKIDETIHNIYLILTMNF